MLGIAVASQELKVLIHKEEPVPESIEEEDGNSEKGEDVLVLPYSEQGLATVLGMADGDVIVLAGNHSWAKPLAYALTRHGKEVRYVTPRKAERGQILSQVKFLQNALARGVTGKPFTSEQYQPHASGPTEDAVAHPWVELDNRYVVVMNDLRRAKHRIINSLRVIFPELVGLETKIWGKKALAALEDEDFRYFRKHGLDYSVSLGRYFPEVEQAKARHELKDCLAKLRDVESDKARVNAEIDRITCGHSIVKMFDGSDSAKRLALLIGWRNWGRTRQDFRGLRKYAGLAVSRVDSKGNPRISRERPAIRTCLYFMLRTNEGKRIIEEAKARLGRELKKRPKRMEILLKEIWRECLQDSK